MCLRYSVLILATLTAQIACMSSEPIGLALAPPADTTVKYDFYHRPLPEIPLPNDIATRHDPSSATGLRINASMVAPTQFESRVRELLDRLDGWGLFQPIVIPFTGPLQIQSILNGHRDEDYNPANDVIYLVNVDPDSTRFGDLYPLDLGNGNYPVVLERLDNYWKNDPRAGTLSLSFEETNEDLNGNGLLDPGEDTNGNGLMEAGEDLNGNGILDPPEDTDADGRLDRPNYLPGATPDSTDLGARADALMTFYERETNTLIARTMVPLDERTTYAVVVTRRLLDAQGDPVGSPFPFINHTAQTRALQPLRGLLPNGLDLDDVAFAFTFTTQTAQSAIKAVRDGLYGHGVQGHIGEQFPAQIAGLEILRHADSFPNMSNPYILPAETWSAALRELRVDISGDDAESAELAAALDSLQYVDYYVIGSFESPQLFPREGADGVWLGLNDQSWPEDLDRKPAPVRSERVYFTLSVPRKEVSARGEGKQAPLLLQGHGYTSNRFEGMSRAGFFAQYGFATLAIDGPSHGLGLSLLERELAYNLLEDRGLRPTADALFLDRIFNQDHDPFGIRDSGADFWTSYLFHTRDVVRQYALDFMQAVRIIRSFDGSRHWEFDFNGDGHQELAGDFDGDGKVDVGDQSMMTMLGGSLGGIISMLVGSIEPEITAIAPIAGGGGFGDMGIRTTQNGAREAFILRAMGPLFVGTLSLTTGRMEVETIIPDLNDDNTLLLGTVSNMKPWDTMVVENLSNGERDCGYINDAGLVRTAVACDVGDALRILFYNGPMLTGEEKCEIRPGITEKSAITTFQETVYFQYDEENQPYSWEVGEPLVALAEGLGLRRAHPDLRRFQGLGQLILDPSDPATYARHLSAEPLFYPGTGQSTATHAMVVTTIGDLAVPANTGIAYGRAAGFIDYRNPDPRFGKPINQVLLDNYVAEAVHTLNRFTDTAGQGVHIDVENFSNGTDIWGTDIPRLAEPLRIGFSEPDPIGGISAAIFPLPVPQGKHGFDSPGGLTDRARRECRSACPTAGTCGCDTLETFDIGYFMFNMAGRYLKSGGTFLSDDHCQSRNDCADIPAFPATRDPAGLY